MIRFSPKPSVVPPARPLAVCLRQGGQLHSGLQKAQPAFPCLKLFHTHPARFCSQEDFNQFFLACSVFLSPLKMQMSLKEGSLFHRPKPSSHTTPVPKYVPN